MIILTWVLLLFPLGPLAILWFRSGNHGLQWAPLCGLTASYAWLIVALLSPFEHILIGPPYSSLRITLPYANIIGVSILVAILLRRKEAALMTLVAGVSVVVCWAYLRVISFAV